MGKESEAASEMGKEFEAVLLFLKKSLNISRANNNIINIAATKSLRLLESCKRNSFLCIAKSRLI